MFRFKQFTVEQDRCAMKVGTDGVLLGAWAHGGHRILDIGTGTGLIALMMAQRYADATVVGIDIDAASVGQAMENVSASPFSERIRIVHADARTYEDGSQKYDSIVSNPPYFNHSLTPPDTQRALARHTTELSYRELMDTAHRLLTDDGELSLIIPFDYKELLRSEAILAGFFESRILAVKTTPRKPARRYMMAFRKHPTCIEKAEGVLEDVPGIRSQWYQELTHDFYL